MVNKEVINCKMLMQKKDQIKRELMLGSLYEQEIINQGEINQPSYVQLKDLLQNFNNKS